MTNLTDTAVHTVYMRRCLELARKGAGRVSPNPMVGAVVVVDGKILGEGWHERLGGPHAEPNAITDLLDNYPDGAELLTRATIYVSLEPCSHFGKTPPCADLIIRHRIPRVVIGCKDPSEKVAGKGIKRLQEAGISVISGVLENECIYLNRRFFTAVRKQRPYIILKWAKTTNGFISPLPLRAVPISSPASRMLMHRWRTEEDAILVGKQTALIDDPMLTARKWPGKNPVRAVIDWNLELPPTLNLFNDEAETYIFNGLKTDAVNNLKYFQLEFREYLPQYILYQLYLMDLHSVIIEGGSNLLQQFINAGLWDEVRIFTGGIQFESGLPAPLIQGVRISLDEYGTDRLEVLENPAERLY